MKIDNRDRTIEPGYLNFKENRKQIYHDRKERQVCVDCEAELEEDDGARCKRCDSRDKATKEIYRHTPKGRRAQRRNQRNTYRKRKKRNICIQCGLPRPEWPPRPPAKRGKASAKPLVCPVCRVKANEAAQRYRMRKKLGIVSIASERRKRDAEKLRELRGKEYRPLDDLLARPRARILRALRHFDWATVDDLFDAIGVPTFDHDDRAERDAHSQMLSRLVTKFGYVERRQCSGERAGRQYEYRLTAAGREAVKVFGT